MRSSNKTISICFFLVINIVCVTCAPKYQVFRGETSQSKSIKISEEKINECIAEISEEFNHNSPLGDLLYAFFNIKYLANTWDSITNTNQQSYRGKAVLKRSARYYYLELFYTALEVVYVTGVPKLLTPNHFCDRGYWSEKYYCTRSIEAMGCGADVAGIICLEKLYIYWKKPDEPESSPISGTEELSDEKLLQAIYRGSDIFQDLSDEDLFEAISREYDILTSLSDREFLQDFYKEFYESLNEPLECRFSYEFEFEQILSSLEHHNRPEYEKIEKQRQTRLNEIRLKRYGIADVSFEDVCKEYIRRKNLPKPFGTYYATYFHDTIERVFDGSKLRNRKDYCEDYLTELELISRT